MPQPKKNAVLFLCAENCLPGRCAEALFNAVAGKMGLPWKALAKTLSIGDGQMKKVKLSPAAKTVLDAMRLRISEGLCVAPEQLTADDLEQADRIIAVNHAVQRPLLLERFPAWAEKVEHWEIDDSIEALARIEHEVTDLTARLIRGGERQKAPPPDPNNANVIQSTKESSKNVTVRVGRETKGRRGKGVTTISDLPLNEIELTTLTAKLKQRLGTGGTTKDGKIEIQGDHRDRLIAELEKMGYRAKRSGG